MGLPLRKTEEKQFTYADYLTWDDGERWELIEGVPYNMSPAPSTRHQEVSGELFAQIHGLLQGKPCKVFAAPFDVRLPEADEEDWEASNVVQPDISVICDRSKLDQKGCKGAPDWVIEIISPSTASKDYRKKLFLYERHGVKEYWLVHPDHNLLMVYRLGADNRYERPVTYDAEDRIEISFLPGLFVDLKMVFESNPL
jgi:Uma2 family endonuclease